jgi:hypothetical protein
MVAIRVVPTAPPRKDALTESNLAEPIAYNGRPHYYADVAGFLDEVGAGATIGSC